MKIITPIFLVSSFIFSNVMAQTYYNETNIDSINMNQSGIGRSQTTVVNTDAYGNVQTFTVGGGNVQVLKPMPCVKVKPTRRMNCRGKDLSGVNWDGLDVADSHFNGANLSKASLVNTNLTNGQFPQANLSNADMENAMLVNANFRQAQLGNANLQRAIITNGDFSASDLTHANLAQTDLTNASFDSANLTAATLQGSGMVNVSFDRAIMAYTIWKDGRQCNANNRCPKDDFFGGSFWQ